MMNNRDDRKVIKAFIPEELRQIGFWDPKKSRGGNESDGSYAGGMKKGWGGKSLLDGKKQRRT